MAGRNSRPAQTGPAGIIEVDVHGMTRRQARTHLENQLRRAGGGVYRLRVIHGFHGGTELLHLVREEIAKNPRVIRYEVGLNPGETDLVLREYY